MPKGAFPVSDGRRTACTPVTHARACSVSSAGSAAPESPKFNERSQQEASVARLAFAAPDPSQGRARDIEKLSQRVVVDAHTAGTRPSRRAAVERGGFSSRWIRRLALDNADSGAERDLPTHRRQPGRWRGEWRASNSRSADSDDCTGAESSPLDFAGCQQCPTCVDPSTICCAEDCDELQYHTEGRRRGWIGDPLPRSAGTVPDTHRGVGDNDNGAQKPPLQLGLGSPNAITNTAVSESVGLEHCGQHRFATGTFDLAWQFRLVDEHVAGSAGIRRARSV